MAVPAVFFVFFGVVVVLMVVIVVVSHIAAKRRREALAALAAGAGGPTSPRDDRWVRRSTARRSDSATTVAPTTCSPAQYDGRAFVAFDYQYSTTATSTDAEGHTQSSTETHPLLGGGARRRRHPAGALGHPGGFPRPDVGRLTGSDIELESEAFNRAFTVRADDRKFATDVLHPRMMEYLLRIHDRGWRFSGRWLLAIRSGSHSIAELDDRLTDLDGILDLVPGFVWNQAGLRARPDGNGMSAATTVVLAAVAALVVVSRPRGRDDVQPVRPAAHPHRRVLGRGGRRAHPSSRPRPEPRPDRPGRMPSTSARCSTALVRAREAAAAHRDGGRRAGCCRTRRRSVAAWARCSPARRRTRTSRRAPHFLDLQHQLTDTEDRIAAARRFYNLNVSAFNTRVATFPSNLVAAAFHFEPREFFELTDPAIAPSPKCEALSRWTPRPALPDRQLRDRPGPDP